jgi:hypothetical protein
VQGFAIAGGMNAFGPLRSPRVWLLSPTPRLRRELRMAFFSVMLGIVIGAAAVIALSGNKTPDDAQVSGLSSASVISEHPTEGMLANEVKDHTSNSNGTKAQVNSENDKPNATTTCEGANPSCGATPPHASRPRAMRKPAANDAVAIGRAPLGRPVAPTTEMLSVAPSESSERALERSAAGHSEEAAADPGSPDRLMDKKPHKSARARPRERAANYRNDRGGSRIGRVYERPRGELDRTYALDRSYGPRSFWDWSR